MLKHFFLLFNALLLVPPAASASIVPEAGMISGSFLTRPEVSDLTLFYSVSDRVSFGFHGIRNHWPQKVELHYGLARVNAKLWEASGPNVLFRVFAFGGAGLANKLKGVDRVALLGGVETDYRTKHTYHQVRAFTLGARDFDQKYFIRARAGLFPYLASPSEWQALVMMHALYENHAQHRVEWGPALELSYKNIATEFYGNFKGSFHWAFSFVY